MAVKHIRIKVFGVVQGVGFRPFVRNLAVDLGISGSVCNHGPYVDIEAQGGEQELAAFLHDLSAKAPARSKIQKIVVKDCNILNYQTFEILQSSQTSGQAFPSPDISICSECSSELFDKNSRRYLHPFINCTACGPRFTILKSMPYDRSKTSMSKFEMCNECEHEYKNPADRRYHAQPVCCNKCGPALKILKKPNNLPENPISAVRAIINSGGIAAIKGIGGFHLCCDASNKTAIERLRVLKNRPQKPFAVMVRDLKTAKREVMLNKETECLLNSPQRPILLLEKRIGGKIDENVAPGNLNIGIMLPYAPVQLLIFDYPDGITLTDCLVMTSGNLSGEPICASDEEALKCLSDLCDIILSNDREILSRADDSVMTIYNGGEYMIRRSRGYVPLPISFVKKGKQSVFAVGGELKNTFCLTNGDKMYLSAHIGDLSSAKSVDVLEKSYQRMKSMLNISPQMAVCDLHPGYNSSAFAKSIGLPVLQVQHHYAHIAACMAENGFAGELIGIAFDGIGYGDDGTIWGGEFLKASYDSYERLSSISPFALAGGDAASRECWRPAVGQLVMIFGEKTANKICSSLGICTDKQFMFQTALIRNRVNCVTATSAGRLFDAVSAILSLCLESTFEGEAAMKVETAAKRFEKTGGKPILLPADTTNDIIKAIAEYACDGACAERLAYSFHDALSRFILNTCERLRDETGISITALSGGTFSNKLLLSMCENKLLAHGFKVFTHHNVPCNDGGLALGQAAVALYHGN